jgi:hypothetical protein
MVSIHPDPYQRGIMFCVAPIPPVAERCVRVDGGPVIFVVESRLLTKDIQAAHLAAAGFDATGANLDDFGATVHVCDADDDVEYLRFDCFESEPHYHYLTPTKGENLVCRIDEVAEGDPMEWTVSRLRLRLPEMLELAGATRLADAVRKHPDEVAPALDRVTDLLRLARIDAATLRESEAN